MSAHVYERVRAEIGVDEVRVGRGVLEVEDDRELLVFDHHRFGRVLGLPCALGEHDRHAVADETDLVARERPVIGMLHVLGDGPRAGQRRGEVVDQVRARDHIDHTGHRRGERGVDGDDLGVRDLAADEAHVRGAGNERSLTKRASPVSSGGSSLRRVRWPRTARGSVTAVIA